MTTQPEALRLADALEDFWGQYSGPEEPHEMNAATELRRLHDLNADLLEALQVMLRDYTAVHDIGDVEMQPAIYQARAAIAKVEGGAA